MLSHIAGTPVYMYMGTYVSMYVCIYVYMYLCICIYGYMYICIYVYIGPEMTRVFHGGKSGKSLHVGSSAKMADGKKGPLQNLRKTLC